MHGQNNNKVVIIIAIITVLAVLTVLGISAGLSIIDARNTELYNREKSSLEFEKSRLLSEKERLKSEIYAELGPHAFLTILVNNLDADFVEAIYDELTTYSIEEMKDYTFTATLLLAPDELPDMEGNMTLEEFNWYLERGYTYALVYDGDTVLADYLENMSALLFDKGIDFPSTICYYGNRNDAILKEADKEVLEQYGITIAASMTGDGLMVEQGMCDGVFSPGILGWNTINVSSNTFNYALTKGGIFGFVFDNERDNLSAFKKSSYISLKDTGYYSAFLRMLDRFNTAIENKKLVVTDYEKGTASRREYLEEYERIKPTLISSLEAIDMQIKEVEKKLSEISDKYKR